MSIQRFRRIGEVSRELGVDPHVLRYWETVYAQHLKPIRSRSGQRFYSESHVATLAVIRDLMQSGYYTQRGVRWQLGMLRSGHTPPRQTTSCSRALTAKTLSRPVPVRVAAERPETLELSPSDRRSGSVADAEEAETKRAERSAVAVDDPSSGDRARSDSSKTGVSSKIDTLEENWAQTW